MHVIDNHKLGRRSSGLEPAQRPFAAPRTSAERIVAANWTINKK